MNCLQKVQEAKIVPVVRKANRSNILPIAQALFDGGIKAIEITAETPEVDMLIKEVRSNLNGLVVGAGTVLDAETARAVIMAGAQFIVSPTVNRDTVKMAKRYGVPCIIGALTPTEMVTAYESGADMVKVFPANIMGADYIKNILGPLPQIQIMATGGIDKENMLDYFHSGAKVVGIGSQLVQPAHLSTKEDFESLQELASQYVEKLVEANRTSLIESGFRK
ncbi:bifunctional 4-hydroxy-2-oxoglutarate aldolase/2-dehydro-3-deoxy-phosphogluconate aldolase [Pseudalkalibacillus hwajinpoensis]|uniref:bifunctional 4-hydroxy-2-oxoglutarate aldolase/2-dehydro-3-deoxy-phosphogluconate aldolase n=1 Tax=Guptibacillus hwajinpoensis TaxID=208199 RepID=UPI00325ADEA2